MLIINGNVYDVISSEIKFVNSFLNKKKLFSLLVSLNFMYNNKKGYITFYIDYFDNKDYKKIENKKYKEWPNNLDSSISMIEIFDTKYFVDSIDSEVLLEFKQIVNNHMEMILNINDDLISLYYSGIINLK